MVSADRFNHWRSILHELFYHS